MANLSNKKAIMEELDECLAAQHRIMRLLAEKEPEESTEVMASLSIRELIAFRTSVTLVKMIGAVVVLELAQRDETEVDTVLDELDAEAEARDVHAD